MPNRRSNPVARSALLRKGGVHERAKSGKRFKLKQVMKREVAELRGGKNGSGSSRFFWHRLRAGCGLAFREP